MLRNSVHSRASGNPEGLGPRFRGDERIALASTGSEHPLALRWQPGSDAKGGGVGRTSTSAAALRAGGGEPSRADRGVVSLRQARRGAEIRHALALRHGSGAVGAELTLARKHRGDDHRDFRRLYSSRRLRHRRRAPLLLVPLARDGVDAALGQPEHDPQGRARAADHRVVQIRHWAERHDGVRHLLLSDRAHHRARLARSRAGPARPRAHAARLALAALHQDSASRRAALRLLRHEGRRDPRGRRRHRRRIPRLRPRSRLPHAAGAGHARHRRHVHGGDPDHADRRGALRHRARARAHAGGARRAAGVRRARGRTTMGEPFIHLAAVQKVYRTRGTDFLAISEATFDVEAGELVSLVGPSGCGKTPLRKLLAGLHPFDSGELKIGSTAQPFDPSRDIGMVFQAPLLLKWRRVIDNVLLPAEILGLPMAASRARARDLLALVGLKGKEDRYPYELAGGMQQRAAIARPLIHDPNLILRDEPFGALDALTREKMNLELLRIWEEAKKTIVFVTHGITEAVFLGTRVIVLTAGPARMADNFPVELPHPRTLEMKTTAAFGEYTRRIYRLLGME